MFLVINDNKDSLFMPNVEKYRLFNLAEDAVKHARSIGFESMFGLGINTKPGVANLYQCGDVKVTILSLDSL